MFTTLSVRTIASSVVLGATLAFVSSAATVKPATAANKVAPTRATLSVARDQYIPANAKDKSIRFFFDVSETKGALGAELTVTLRDGAKAKRVSSARMVQTVGSFNVDFAAIAKANQLTKSARLVVRLSPLGKTRSGISRVGQDSVMNVSYEVEVAAAAADANEPAAPSEAPKQAPSAAPTTPKKIGEAQKGMPTAPKRRRK